MFFCLFCIKLIFIHHLIIHVTTTIRLLDTILIALENEDVEVVFI